jgi:hypothetical protein
MQRIDDAEDRVVSAPESWRGESADMASLGRPFHIDVAVRRRELLPPELELKSRADSRPLHRDVPHEAVVLVIHIEVAITTAATIQSLNR